MPLSGGGTSTVPSGLSPSFIRELEMPIEGMTTLVGVGVGVGVGAGGCLTCAATDVGGAAGEEAGAGAAEQPASTVRAADTTRAGSVAKRRTGGCAGVTTGCVAERVERAERSE